LINEQKIRRNIMGKITVPFVIHKHDPRSGSIHYDLRFIDGADPKILNSFALPSDFPSTINHKTVVVRTREHDPRWLNLKSYRLDTFDKGDLDIIKGSRTYFKLDFRGKKIKGIYELFKMKTKRENYWLLIKSRI